MSKLFVSALVVLIFNGCTMMDSSTSSTFDIQGHRGCRGLMPENTVPAFLHAADLGVNTLEMDVVISKDKQVIVSHEPWVSGELCALAEGLAPEQTNIYNLTAEEVQEFDCGSKPHPRFPDQQKFSIVKPTLDQMIQHVEVHTGENGYAALRYNIEIKSKPEGDNRFHPEPKEFVQLVLAVLREKGIVARTTIQSFDARIMEEVHKQAPKVTTAWLIESNPNHVAALDELSFQPDIYSCYYALLTPEAVTDLHHRNMMVKPWTVNDREDMERLMEMGVDGIITDYPDLLIQLVAERNELVEHR